MEATQSATQQAVELLTETKAKLQSILSGPAHSMILLGVNADFNRLINRMAFLSGQALPTVQNNEHPPVTDFMGEKLETVAPLAAEDLNPSEEARQVYLDKVDKLYAQFGTQTPEQILEANPLPEDQLVIRGVAKRAGVPGFDTETINVDFLDRVAKAVAAKNELDAQQQRIESNQVQTQTLEQLTKQAEDSRLRADQLNESLAEAESDLSKATKAADKKAAQAKIDELKGEIDQNQKAWADLQTQIAQLNGGTANAGAPQQ